MLVTLETVGSGTEDDPIRVALPTWRLVDIDYSAKQAVVEIPETDVLPGVLEDPDTGLSQRSTLPHIVYVSEPVKVAWLEYIRNRYQERALEYDLHIKTVPGQKVVS